MCEASAEKAASISRAQANVPKVEPQIRLARLMERELGLPGLTLDPIALRLFIIAHWGKVSALAHQTHDENAKSNG
jgi:hypothetical protein